MTGIGRDMTGPRAPLTIAWPMKILVVSEDPRALDFVRTSVGSDATYSSASNGLEAIRVAAVETPECVIADETTEPFGAFGLSRELKMLGIPPRVIVILERSQDTWLAKWSGADRWFVRPVDPFELAEAVRSPAPIGGTA
jgi:DNA-binding response OmpR family regulator